MSGAVFAIINAVCTKATVQDLTLLDFIWTLSKYDNHCTHPSSLRQSTEGVLKWRKGLLSLYIYMEKNVVAHHESSPTIGFIVLHHTSKQNLWCFEDT